MFQVSLEKPADGPAIEKLLDQSFGSTRLQLTAYCLRNDTSALPELCFVMRGASFLCASIRYWPVLIEGKHKSLLLGPLAVGQAWRGQGFGGILLRHSLARAKALGHQAVLVIGSPEYYQPFGFSAELTHGLSLPKAVDDGRFQACELAPGALTGVSGAVASARDS
ncbi:MAG: N-acetyltransferase [Rhodospirillaceae bacterium]|jgi:predicted N-acetyltransferase YhbS|nr:N-acetyltransferase [Rhodospirillaceae bacterium]MBT3492962.1 N-acetyltransferase [Rhodospirillaceae bacterium]MBT3780481.1 N-acetyltransferase [Rhodospirillaceae bacterium]MBT3977265.1 N-acetyltransferase [Rhodospirillaceae bacterium]MBT4167537.1 N-acetyltransferase [Rhodospirillaceae bacterium]